MKFRISIFVFGVLLLLGGMFGVLYNMDQLNFVYETYPLGAKEIIYSNSYNDITEINVNTKYYDVTFIEGDIENIQLEIYSTDIIQEYICSVEINDEEGILNINSTVKSEVLENKKNKIDSLKTQVIFSKKLIKDYDQELKNNNFVVPSFNSYYKNIKIIIKYPKGYKLNNVNINTNGQYISVNHSGGYLTNEQILDRINNEF